MTGAQEPGTAGRPTPCSRRLEPTSGTGSLGCPPTASPGGCWPRHAPIRPLAAPAGGNGRAIRLPSSCMAWRSHRPLSFLAFTSCDETAAATDHPPTACRSTRIRIGRPCAQPCHGCGRGRSSSPVRFRKDLRGNGQHSSLGLPLSEPGDRVAYRLMSVRHRLVMEVRTLSCEAEGGNCPYRRGVPPWPTRSAASR